LRGEGTLTRSLRFDRNATFENNYFHLFPSAFLSYNLGEGASAFINYSRRIQRPSMWGLAPLYNMQDPLNLRLGNPMLQPELTDSYELGYNKSWSFLFLTTAVYHRRTDDLMTRFYILNDNNAVIQTWQNANSRLNTGLEVIQQYYLARWLDLNVTGNFFHAKVFGDNILEGLSNENFTWTINVLSGLRMGKWGSMQFNANYRGPIVLPQGEIEPLYSVNVGYRTDLWQRRATLSLNVTDVFNTRVFRIRTADARFDQLREFDRETQIGTVTFTYRFGGFKPAERERRYGNGDSDDPF
jgi:iron complex outermembrane receptor protein